jgi:hypothetical protein
VKPVVQPPTAVTRAPEHTLAAPIDPSEKPSFSVADRLKIFSTVASNAIPAARTSEAPARLWASQAADPIPQGRQRASTISKPTPALLSAVA